MIDVDEIKASYPICRPRAFFGSQMALRQWQKTNSVGGWDLEGMVLHWMAVVRYFDDDQPSMRQLYGGLGTHIGRFNGWADRYHLGSVRYPTRKRFDSRARNLISWIERDADANNFDLSVARALLATSTL